MAGNKKTYSKTNTSPFAGNKSISFSTDVPVVIDISWR